jgi:carbonic anhydrase/acetyltransferase-like protein (isoleucine patch superfamily)
MAGGTRTQINPGTSERNSAAGLFCFQPGRRRDNPALMPDLAHQLETFLRKQPVLGRGVYLAKTAVVLGDVTLGDYSSVWYGAVLRGDINRIVVGHHSNIQDNAVLHLADDYPCLVGNWVTIGHSAIVHACTVGDECLVGMGATLLDGAVIGAQSIIGANALVTQGTVVPDGSLVLGSPAKVVKQLTPEQRAGLKYWAEKYVHNAAYCLQHGINVGAPLAT